jgi:hypothetical protein
METTLKIADHLPLNERGDYLKNNADASETALDVKHSIIEQQLQKIRDLVPDLTIIYQ